MTQLVDSLPGSIIVPPLTEPKVLVVDDDEDDQFIIGQAFIQFGKPVQLSFAADGIDCLNYLSTVDQLPDLILLDLNMPRLNGIEVLQQVRAVPQWEALLVVILSTTNDHPIMQVAISCGATEFLTKPTHYADYSLLMEQIHARYL